MDKAALGARQTHGVKYTHYILHAHIWAWSGVHTVYYTPIFTTSQALLYLFCEAHFNIMVVHVTLGSIVKRPRAKEGGGTNIFEPNLFVPAKIYINVGHKGGGQIWTIGREGVTSRQALSPPAADDSRFYSWCTVC